MEPIRKPVHRPRPPHPHVQQRPHAVLVRSRLLPAELDPEETRQPQTAPTRPALVPAPPSPRIAEPVTPPPAALTSPEELQAPFQRPKERNARGLLLITLALHLAVVLATWFAQPASGLETADLLLTGMVLLSGGTMLVLGGARRR
jgi:hypothetical protein